MRLSVVLVPILMLAACGSDGPADPDPSGSGGQDASWVGTWVDTGGTSVELQLAADGSGTGNDGCNVGSGAWHVEDDQLILDRWASTLRACMEPSAAFGNGEPLNRTADDTIEVPSADSGGAPFVLRRVVE